MALVDHRALRWHEGLLIFSYVVSGWLMGQDPPAFDILAWNSDCTRMPAAMHSFYLRHLYIGNELSRERYAPLRDAPGLYVRG